MLRKLPIIILLINFYIISSDSAKILGVVPSPSFSHQTFFRPIWKELARRGHDLTILTTDPMNESKFSNIHEIDLSFTYKLWQEKHNVTRKIEEASYKLWKIFQIFREALLDIMDSELRHPEVKLLIENKTEHFDLVIAEYLHPIMLTFSNRFQCPYVGVTSLDLPNNYHDLLGNPSHPGLYPDFMLPFYGELSFIERVLSTLIYLYGKLFHDLTPEQNVIYEHFGNDMPQIENLLKNASVVLVNIDPAFNLHPLGPGIIAIGGGTHIESSKPLSKDLKDYLDSAKDGLIYFSLGTNVNESNINLEMRQNIVNTFKKLPYKVLWKFGDKLIDKPDNVKIVKWLPQQDILRHPNVKLFITQGGLQSMDEAITMNVPLVAIPFFADQEMNSNKIVHRGIGLKLDKDQFSEEKFTNAILEVINNPKYVNKMRKISELSKDQPMSGLEKSIWWIEYVLRHKGAKHLKNPSMDLPLYQYLMLDVILFLNFIIISIGFSIWFLYKLLSVKLRGKEKNKME